jgi:hypothetical protein
MNDHPFSRFYGTSISDNLNTAAGLIRLIETVRLDDLGPDGQAVYSDLLLSVAALIATTREQYQQQR